VSSALEHGLLGRIYEAGALPDRWPLALDAIADHVGALGGNLIRSTAAGVSIAPSPRIAEVTLEFDDEGWNVDNSRIIRLLARANHGGFLTDSDLHSAEEIATLPIYRDFLTPRGADAGAATVIQGPVDDGLVITFEAFASHSASRAAVPLLNRLRPHLARAASLSSEVRLAQVGSLVDALNMIGVAVALLDAKGQVVSASQQFAAAFDDLLLDLRSRLCLTDPAGDRRLAKALTLLGKTGRGQSIAVRNREGFGCGVLHLLPARNEARDLFANVATFAVLSRPENRQIPGADVIGALFDLTPAEARVARQVAQGRSPIEIAGELGISAETARSHLKRVFAKTSTNRQSELAALIGKFL
jgi:DNA-binding CsgD family transcriptional regulator